MADVSIIIGRRIRCQTEFHRQMAVVLSDLDIRQGAHLIKVKRKGVHFSQLTPPNDFEIIFPTSIKGGKYENE